MILRIIRDIFGKDYTLSRWEIDGVNVCYGVEDVDRRDAPKVSGVTAIPVGDGILGWDFSSRFDRRILTLRGVVGFAGIRIHAGNSAKDSRGCPLPGLTRNTTLGTVGESRAAVAKIEGLLRESAERGDARWVVCRDEL